MLDRVGAKLHPANIDSGISRRSRMGKRSSSAQVNVTVLRDNIDSDDFNRIFAVSSPICRTLKAAGNLSTNQHTIAIIDDDPSVLKGLKRPLDACDFTAEVFSSGEAFLDRTSKSDVTCIVLDIHLGGISGIEVQRRLRAMGSTIPVIFMTALDNVAIRREAIDAGCAAYLPKPFSGHVLIDLIWKATSPV